MPDSLLDDLDLDFSFRTTGAQDSETVGITDIRVDFILRPSGGPEEKIGYAQAQIVDHWQGASWDTCDAHAEGDLQSLWIKLFGSSKWGTYTKAVCQATGRDEDAVGAILHLDYIRLDAQYRRRGLGLKLIKRVVHALERGCDLITLKAFPAEDYQGNDPHQRSLYEQKGTEKLMAYYQRLGFAAVTKNYMAFNTECELGTV